jgi:RHS repeat-associated protein
MNVHNRVTSLVALLLATSARNAQAQLRQDALVQAPAIARPARGTLGSDLAGFELGAGALGRGSSALPSPFAIPSERGKAAIVFLPTYVADQGISEWGMGWSVPLSIRRFRAIGDVDYANDRFTSPWGALSVGTDGAYYVDGLQPRMRLLRAEDGWQAQSPDGTVYVFRSSDAQSTPRGIYEWWLSEARTATGERTQFEYEVGPGGRRYLSRVTYGGRTEVPQVRVQLIYDSVVVPFVDRRSGTAVPLDRRVARVAVMTWNSANSEYVERYHYDLGYTQSPAGVAHYLSSVQRSFPTAAEPVLRYSYRFGEEDALSATVHEAADLSSYLQRFGPGSLAPNKASYLDLDRDGRTDIECAANQELALHTDNGFTYEALPRDGSEFPFCRPNLSTTNEPRTLVRVSATDPELSVLRFLRPSTDTTAYRCDRRGRLITRTTLEGDWRLGPNLRLADVDRDLKPDLVRFTRGQVEVRRNQSEATKGDKALLFAAVTRQALSPEIEPSRSWVLDLTADGLADLVAVVRSGIYVWPGLGNGQFEAEAQRYSLFNPNGVDLGSIEESEIAFVDANRDGLTDLLLSQGSQLRLLTHHGDRFQQIAVPAFASLRSEFSYPITVDLEGEGEEQAVVSAGLKAYAISFTSATAGLLVEAEDGKGGKLRFDYQRAPANPGIAVRPPLVSELFVEDAGQDPLELRFDFAAPVFHSQALYLLGYRQVRRTSARSIEEVELYHDDAQSSLPLRTQGIDTVATGLPRGLYTFAETSYEPAQFQGLTYQRQVASLAGLADADGNEVSGSRTATVRWSDNGLCPLEVQVQGARSLLTSTRTLAAPSALEGVLHCLFASEREQGVHPGSPELDFTHEATVTYTNSGLVENVVAQAGEQSQVLQHNRYDAQQRLSASGRPGHGEATASYDPVSGELSRVTTADGVEMRALRDPVTSAVLVASEARGAFVPYETQFVYDALERLSSRYDNLGFSTAAVPDESISYAYADAQHPASIVSRTLVDAAAQSAAERAEWLTASSTAVAQASRIPEGWAIGSVARTHRARGEVTTSWREPLLTSAAHEVTLAELFDAQHSTELSRRSASLVGHTPRLTSVQSAAAQRVLTQELSLVGGEVAVTRLENGVVASADRFDGDGRLLEHTDANGNTTQVRFDALGRLAAVALPGGAAQSLTLDGFGRPRRLTRTGLGAVEYDYELESGLLSEKRFLDPKNLLIRRTRSVRDALGREIERIHESGENGRLQRYQFLYDGLMPGGGTLPGQQGRLTTVRGPAYDRVTEYDADGRVRSRNLQLTGWRDVLDYYEYFEDGVVRRHEREIRDAAGAHLNTIAKVLQRDEFGRTLGLSIRTDAEPEHPLYRLSYDTEGRIATVTLGDGEAVVLHTPFYDAVTHTERGYALFGEEWELQVQSEISARGLIAAERVAYQPSGGASEVHDRTYDYDARRFLSALSGPDPSAGYTYGADGLLTRIQDSLGDRQIVRNSVRWRAGSTDLPLDNAGRITRRLRFDLRYGPNGQLERASRSDRTLEFAYDENDQRLLKSKQGAAELAYLDGSVLSAQGIVEPLRVSGKVVGLVENGTFIPLPTDPRGSLLSASNGSYRGLSPYGVRQVRPELAAILDYVGLGYDADLGSVRMGVRDYDPYLGQFTTPDPLLLENLTACAESPVECNLYGYAANDPVSGIDPHGTRVIGAGEAVALAFPLQGASALQVADRGPSFSGKAPEPFRGFGRSGTVTLPQSFGDLKITVGPNGGGVQLQVPLSGPGRSIDAGPRGPRLPEISPDTPQFNVPGDSLPELYQPDPKELDSLFRSIEPSLDLPALTPFNPSLFESNSSSVWPEFGPLSPLDDGLFGGDPSLFDDPELFQGSVGVEFGGRDPFAPN